MLRRRRVRASVSGGALGTGVGVGVLAWLAVQLSQADV